jgi:hypothetical protein
MEGTYRAELENDGNCLLLTVDAADRLRLKVAIPWEQITKAVSQEIRARFTQGNIAIHFIGSRDGLRFSLRDLTESWVDRFDPSDARSLAERDALIGELRECLTRLEATAALE